MVEGCRCCLELGLCWKVLKGMVRKYEGIAVGLLRVWWVLRERSNCYSIALENLVRSKMKIIPILDGSEA